MHKPRTCVNRPGHGQANKEPDIRTVPLHGKKAAGRVALVDDADYDLVMAHNWFIRERARGGSGHRNSGPYAQANVKGVRLPDGRQPVISMHNLIMGCTGVDHINHDGLDNQRANLRPATYSQNLANQRPREGCTSRYKGVCWDSANQKWRAEIQVSGHRNRLGRFDVEKDAARAYDAAALAAWGEYACLNFVPVVAPGSESLSATAWPIPPG